MKPFSKFEIRGIIIIFLVLIAISVPNFIASLRRARDQVRKDDMGAVWKALGAYQNDFGGFPLATNDGKIVACMNPGDKVTVDKLGHLTVKFIPCNWGKDAFTDFMPGNSKEYMAPLPRDPNFEKGVSYEYFSDGHIMQFLVSLESKDDPEYDPKIIARGLMCGNVVCNAGRDSGCPTDKSLQQCEEEAVRNKQISK